MSLLLRRGTAAQWTASNPTLLAGEPGFETDTGRWKLGDGATAWATLLYAGIKSLGGATGAATTVGPVIWTGTYRLLMGKYWIQGYNGGTPVGRLLLGSASISTTALTNSFSLSEGVTAPTTGSGATAIPGCPLAVTLSNIGRGGFFLIDGASGAVKSIELYGRNVSPSVASIPTLFRGASFFSDLGTNLPIQRAQLSVYDTLATAVLSAQAFVAGTTLDMFGLN